MLPFTIVNSIMKTSVLIVLVLSAAAAALPAITQFEDYEPSNEHRGWQTWNAVRNWLRPATNYITQSLPDKTPSEFAGDVRDAAVDFRDTAQDHPVVRGVARVVSPVHEWVRDTASGLSKTSFRDIFHSAKGYVSSADERVAQWLNNRNSQLQNRPGLPLAQNIEQILH